MESEESVICWRGRSYHDRRSRLMIMRVKTHEEDGYHFVLLGTNHMEPIEVTPTVRGDGCVTLAALIKRTEHEFGSSQKPRIKRVTTITGRAKIEPPS
jgi:hypothetical protein